jgi:hypothetical protein
LLGVDDLAEVESFSQRMAALLPGIERMIGAFDRTSGDPADISWEDVAVCSQSDL